ALFWPVVTKRAVITSLFTGFFSGLLWYYLGGWEPNVFYLNIHPVWVGSSINVLTIMGVTLLDPHAEWFIQTGKKATTAYFALTLGILLTTVNIFYFDLLYQSGLTGLFLFTTIIAFFIT